MLGACYGQIAPLYEAQSSLTSGTLVAAGSIGVVALAGRAGSLIRNTLTNTVFVLSEKKKIKLMYYSDCRGGGIVCP